MLLARFLLLFDVGMLATRNEAHTTGAFVDYSSFNSLCKIIGTTCTTGVDESDVVPYIRWLLGNEWDRWGDHQTTRCRFYRRAFHMMSFRYWALCTHHCWREVLLINISLNGGTDVIGLTGKVGWCMVVLILLESRVSQVAPKNRSIPSSCASANALDTWICRFEPSEPK